MVQVTHNRRNVKFYPIIVNTVSRRESSPLTTRSGSHCDYDKNNDNSNDGDDDDDDLPFNIHSEYA